MEWAFSLAFRSQEECKAATNKNRERESMCFECEAELAFGFRLHGVGQKRHELQAEST